MTDDRAPVPSPDPADDPLGPARPVTEPASARPSPSRVAGGRRRRAHPAKWGRRVAAGGASLAVAALTLHLAGATATTGQASGVKASGTSIQSEEHEDGGDDDDSAAQAGSSSSSSANSSSAGSSSSASSASSTSSKAVSTSRGS